VRWKREDRRWKMEAKNRGRMEYRNDGIVGKTHDGRPFNIPLFHSSIIPHLVFPRLLWVK
jgi:hypothetical protein